MGQEVSKTPLTDEELQAFRQRGRDAVLKYLNQRTQDKNAPIGSRPVPNSHALGTLQNPVLLEEGDDEDQVKDVTTNKEKGGPTDAPQMEDEQRSASAAQAHTLESLQNPVVATIEDDDDDDDDDDKVMIITTNAEKDGLVSTARPDSEERDEAMPTVAGRRPVYRPQDVPALSIKLNRNGTAYKRRLNTNRAAAIASTHSVRSEVLRASDVVVITPKADRQTRAEG